MEQLERELNQKILHFINDDERRSILLKYTGSTSYSDDELKYVIEQFVRDLFTLELRNFHPFQSVDGQRESAPQVAVASYQKKGPKAKKAVPLASSRKNIAKNSEKRNTLSESFPSLENGNPGGFPSAITEKATFTWNNNDYFMCLPEEATRLLQQGQFINILSDIQKSAQAYKTKIQSLNSPEAKQHLMHVFREEMHNTLQAAHRKIQQDIESIQWMLEEEFLHLDVEGTPIQKQISKNMDNKSYTVKNWVHKTRDSVNANLELMAPRLFEKLSATVDRLFIELKKLASGLTLSHKLEDVVIEENLETIKVMQKSSTNNNLEDRPKQQPQIIIQGSEPTSSDQEGEDEDAPKKTNIKNSYKLIKKKLRNGIL